MCKESIQLEIIKKSEITKKAPARSLFYRETRNIWVFFRLYDLDVNRLKI